MRLLFLLIAIQVGQCWAAPMPATSSSALIRADAGFFWARHGFKLNTQGTDWLLHSGKLGDETVEARFIPRKTGSASLSVKTDSLPTNMGLDAFARRWLKDYLSYGFRLMGSKPFNQEGNKGLVIDLYHEKSKKQLRQAVFLKNKQLVILTCNDLEANIKQSLGACNQIIKSFAWHALDQ